MLDHVVTALCHMYANIKIGICIQNFLSATVL